MSLTPEQIIQFRKVLRTGILDKSLDELRKGAAAGDTASQIAFLKVMYGQTAHTFNTYAGTMLTQLATLSYLQANPKERQLDEKAPLEKEFTVFSKDTLMARRLLLGRVTIPNVAASASIEAMLSFGSEQQAAESERDKKEILRLRGELELSKIAIQRLVDRSEAEAAKTAISVDLKPVTSKKERKETAITKGLDGGEAVTDDAVLNKSITMIEQGGDTIDWK